ncbi:zinc finger BED domain-containing 4-like protein [Labeo rohita]|uniref:Zinc finger BED domain-containing 4-like protein n=1 Tax=Labeo rohita TaxID=84645 RepID=A0A498N550_LABRO|nr:zinc finger BED domain-containing 4-like protein [Labeo rohita]
METEDAQDAFVTIKRLYESLLNVAIAEKATSRVGETPAPNSKQTETPPIHNTADPASESTPLLPCNVSTLTQSVLKFSQPSPISSSLASPLPPAPILSASSKLNPVSTELGRPDTVSYAQKKRQIKRKTEPKECPIHKDSTSFPYKKILRKRIREWDEVEKHLGATRKYSKFILKMYSNVMFIPDVVKQPARKEERPSMSGAFFSHIKYKPDSQEQRIKEEAIAKWVARTAHPPRTVEDEEFINMMEKIDKRLTVPKKTKITNLVDQMYLAEKVKFKNRLAMARKVTIGIDIWTKKGLTASFLAVSACCFNVQDSKAEHILLNLKQMVHPHTANSIVTLVEECTEEWGILKEKIIMIITDNGSNMVSAFRVEEEDTSSDENDSNKDSDEEEEADERYGTLERTPCVVHTLQLVVNMVKKEQAIKRLLDKVRHLAKITYPM